MHTVVNMSYHITYHISNTYAYFEITIKIQLFKLRMSEVEQTLNRMQTHKNVQGIVIVNNEGSIIRSTYLNERKEEGNTLARLIPQLVSKAKNTVRDLDTTNDLKFIRLKTTKYQILIAPDNQFILIVVQGQKTEAKEEEDI